MEKQGWTWLLAAALACTLGSEHAQGQLRPFKFATTGSTVTSAPEFYYGVAVEKGWFKEAGIDFQLIRMFSAVAFPAIAGGQIDGTSYSGSAPSAALRGAPLVVVFNAERSMPWSLIVNPQKIKTPKDFAGARCVATTGRLGAPHVAAAAMIASIGGDPNGFQPVALGQPPPFWLEAMRAGTAECMMGSDAAWTRAAEREGFKSLAYLPKVKPMPAWGLAVSPAALKDPEKRRLTADVIGVFMRSLDFAKNPANRSEFVDMVIGWIGSPKGLIREDYEAAVTELLELMVPEGLPPDIATLGNILTVGVEYGIYDPKEFKVNPRGIDLVKAGVVDQSLVKEVAARGGPLFRAR